MATNPFLQIFGSQETPSNNGATNPFVDIFGGTPEQKNLNIKLPAGNLNLGTSGSTMTSLTSPKSVILPGQEKLTSSTPQQVAESKQVNLNPFQNAINNYNQNTINKMTTGQKVSNALGNVSNYLGSKVVQAGKNVAEGKTIFGQEGIPFSEQIKDPMFVLNFSPLGIEKALQGGTEKVIKDVFGTIAKTKEPEAVYNILKPRFPGVADDVLRNVSNDLSKVNTKQGVQDYFKYIQNEAQKVSQGTDLAVQENPFKQIFTPEVKAPVVPIYQGETDLTTNILKDLEGKTTVSKQYILDATNRPELKQSEKDLTRQVLDTMPDTVNVNEFANKLKAELLPLEVKSSDTIKPQKSYGAYGNIGMVNEGEFTPKYEFVSLPNELKGNVKNYKENIYQSPIKTSAGDTHFAYTAPNYFGHTRIEDMADNKTRRVIEVQSDLYQKGNLEKELNVPTDSRNADEFLNNIQAKRLNELWSKNQTTLSEKENKELDNLFKIADENAKKGLKLQQYNDPTAHFRMVREEIKKAAEDGKNILQFPTGETAMKIEGLGDNGQGWDYRGLILEPNDLETGIQVRRYGEDWIITDVLGDGKFKAVPKEKYDAIQYNLENGVKANNDVNAYSETFDISGKVDTNNPIYKFYEKDLGRYLKNKYNAVPVTDSKGVTWYQVDVKPEMKGAVTAFKASKDIFTHDISKEEFKKGMRKIFTDKEIELITGKDISEIAGLSAEEYAKDVQGFYRNGKLGVKEDINGMIQSFVAGHEAGHGFFDMFTSPTEKRNLLDYIIKNKSEELKQYSSSVYKTIDQKAEEYLVDDFAKRFKENNNFANADGFFKTLYKKIVKVLTDLFKKKDIFQKFYDRVLSKDRSYVKPTSKTIPVKSLKIGEGESLSKLPSKETSKLESSISKSQSQSETKLPNILKSSSYSDNIPQDFNTDNYIKEQVAKRENAKNAEKVGIINKAKSFLANAKTKLVDFSAPIEDVLNTTIRKNKLNILPEDNIHNQIDRVLRSPTLAGQFAKDNGIVDVIKKVDNIDALDQYLIAKHAIELDQQGIKTGRDIAKDIILVKELAPKYEKYAKVISQYSQKLLDYSVESGLISKELATALKEKYPDYVPFSRVFSELEKAPSFAGGSAIASLSKQNIVQRIIGSEREIESPIETLLAKTNDAFKQGEKNKAGKMLASYETLPNNPFQLKDITGEEIGNRYTVSFLDNGVKKTYQTTKEVSEAAKALNVQQMNILGKIFALPVRIARVGITGINLPFVGANIAKDQISAFINSDRGLKTSILNPKNFIKSLLSAVKHDDLYQEMVRAGGAGTSFDISRNQVEQTVKAIRSNKDIKSKIKYVVKNPSELLHAVEDIIGRSEELTRLQQFKGTKDALIKEGMSEKSATIEAARMAREATVNFARRGEWGTVLNSMFLYLNASIQGTRTLLTNLRTKPAKTSMKIILTALLPVAIATAWNLKDEKRRKAYEDIPEYEKENNIIIIPENPTKDVDGKWNVIKIPMSQEINNLVGAVRKPLEQAYGLDPVSFGDIAQSLIGTVSPIAPTKGSILSTITPQAIKPTIESATNKSLYTGNPIVSQGLEKLSPSKQIKPTTSKLAIKLGKQLNMSPIKIDAFIKGTFGSVGSQLTGQQKITDAVFARFGKASGGEILNKEYIQQNAVEQQKADANYEAKQRIRPIYEQAVALYDAGKEQEAQALVDSLSDADYETYKSIRSAEKAKETTAAKRKMIPVYIKLQELNNTNPEEAQKQIDAMTDEEYRIYDLVKKDFAKIYPPRQ